MRKLLTTLGLILSPTLFSQVAIDFEDISIAPNSFINDSTFQIQGVTFSNFNDTTGGYFYWEGFALSNQNDTTTSGWGNQYSSFAGSGAYGSENFLLHYYNGYITLSQPSFVSFEVTNNTYAAIEMRDGSAFSKKFGGVTGDDPDYFKVIVYGYLQNTLVDSTEFYLADFRFSDNSQDYILNTWELVQLNTYCDSITFKYESTDVGMFGINTPQYFCLDNFSAPVFGIDNANQYTLTVYPNPSTDNIQIKGMNGGNLTLYNISGQTVLLQNNVSENQVLNISNIPSGIYILKMEKSGITKQVKIIKQ